MTTSAVGVIGACGAVGTEAVRHLRTLGIGQIRLSGRDLPRVRRLIERELAGSGEAAAVDVLDPDALGRFCGECSVVLNCAGPAATIGDIVGRAALAAGADYVDPAGDDVLSARLADALPPGRRALLSAGMMPGLTGLLPRYLGPAAGGRLVAHIGGLDRFSPAAAADFLLAGTEFGHARTVWRHGHRVPAAAPHRATPPYFPEPVTALPYLSTETERLAADLGLDEVDWFSAFAGEQVTTVLARPTSGPDGVSRLRRAAELDLFGRRSYQLLVFELTRAATRTLVLGGTGASALTGALAALAVAAVLGCEVPPGVWHAAEALDPATVMAALPRLPSVTLFDLVTGSVREPEYVEETL
ncbi:saccharopine dehydrogenase NADP-binding domain-containing protein [Nocardia sp. NPDC051321]|uniref:saccharopine dehydrogenase NADP-binding domain-containing protein n=1 Tax=Nocardia sp. NPDC051321 TaxID=3364323 RepID=UPI0037B1F402